MTIVYRIAKGVPLTAEDLDGNFRELEARIENLESKSKQTSIHYHFALEGHVLTIKDEKDNIVFQAPLPMLRFIPKGLWHSGQEYHAYDLVYHNEAVWCATGNHTASVDFKNDQQQWTFFLGLNDIKGQQ